MDLWNLIFPFIMAVITNSLMIMAIYFLRKIPYFANLFSVWFMVILYLFGALRLFLPIEFPGIHIILRDSVVFNTLIESMIWREDVATGSPSVLMYVILAVWAAGIIVFAVVSATIQSRFVRYIKANSDFTTPEELELFKRISLEVLGREKNFSLKKTDAVDRIMVIGYFRKVVLLPLRDYSADELEMIFRHECMHIKNHDLWLKLLIQIYCCIFWWNPFSYLLKHDLDFTLEMKCDLSVARKLTDAQVVTYLQTIRANSSTNQSIGKTRKKPFLVCAELTDSTKNNELVKRCKAVAADPPKKGKQIIVNVLISLLFVVLLAVSYLFIWQPYYGIDVTEEEFQLANDEIVADETNCYLVEQEDGNYLFYVDDFPPVNVSREEVESGLFEGYPILNQ